VQACSLGALSGLGGFGVVWNSAECRVQSGGGMKEPGHQWFGVLGTLFSYSSTGKSLSS
jgi:hypothetical protein